MSRNTVISRGISRYRGRFAPTPSGPLHLGSLTTAVASFLQARVNRGSWLLRIDDLDAPRCPPGAADQILRQLEAHALHWDESLRVQSAHKPEYLAALERLRDQGRLFACTCTRAVLARQGTAVYPGTCRAGTPRAGRSAWRLLAAPEDVAFADGWQGPQVRRMDRDVGDFVLRRSDGLIAYQLACAVDEPAQGITEVVRGADLLDSTFQQLYVQRQLHLPHALYRHLPVLVDSAGRKLSKQTHAAPVRPEAAGANLRQCLLLLGQRPPEDLVGAPPAQTLAWGIANWNPEAVPPGAAIAISAGAVDALGYNAPQQKR